MNQHPVNPKIVSSIDLVENSGSPKMHCHVVGLAPICVDPPVFLVSLQSYICLDDFILHFCLVVLKKHCVVGVILNLLPILMSCSFLLESGFSVFSCVSHKMLLLLSLLLCVHTNVLFSFFKLLHVKRHVHDMHAPKCCMPFQTLFGFFATESHNSMSKFSKLDSL